MLARTDKKVDGSLQVTNPDFGCAGVEVESALFVDFRWKIGARNDLDADIWSALEQGELGDILCPPRSEPGDIDRFDAAGAGNRALRQGTAVGKELAQESADMCLALAMEWSRGRTQEDVAILIGLDAIRKPGELLIRQNLGPTRQVEGGLRREVRKLDSDRHRQK